MTDTQIGIVCYTDASARPNPGNIGWGAHGYIYEIKDIDKHVNVSNHIVTNKGYVPIKYLEDAVPVKPTHYFDFFGSSLEEGTNNSSELSAFYNSLLKLSEYNPKQIHFLVDSAYVRDGVNDWCKTWERNNWTKHDGTVPSNIVLWKQTHAFIKQLKAKGLEFNIEWVKAHNDILGNTEADILSVIAMNYSTKKLSRFEYTVTEAKNYNTEITKHPFLNYNRIFFNSVTENNIPGHYYQADPGHGVSDFIIGKRHASAGYSVIRLNTPIKVIEDIKQRQYDVAAGMNSIITMKLDEVYSKEMYPYLRDHGGFCLLPLRQSIDLGFIGRAPVTLEINPTGLSMRAIDNFNIMDDILTDFTCNLNGDTEHKKLFPSLNIHCVTKSFYNFGTTTIKVGKVREEIEVQTLEESINSTLKNLNVTITETYEKKPIEVQIPLVFGIDILPRNNLKKIEVENPKIYIVTWKESKDTIRYATIIKTDTGVGIWSNYFADRIFLKNFVKN